MMPATGRDVADEIEIELIVKRNGDHVSLNDQKERMAVGRRTHDRLGADVARSARPIVDNKLLAEALRQPLRDQACDGVGRPASGVADDDAHRPRRIGLRLREARHGRQRGSGRGQM